MNLKLVCLYKNGVAIEKDALADAPPYVGILVAEDWVEGSVFKRPIRYDINHKDGRPVETDEGRMHEADRY